MLLHEPAPQPEDERRPIEPNWRLVLWIAVAVVVGLAAQGAQGLLSFALLCLAVAAGCKAAIAVVDYGGGLTEWRQ